MQIHLTPLTIVPLASLCVWLVGADLAWGQQDPGDQPAAQEPPAEPSTPPRLDYDSEPPYTAYERQWNRRFPAPYRRQFRREYYPYGRPYYQRQYRYGGWRSPYGGYDGYYDPQHTFDGGYISGFHDGRRFQRWEERAERGSNSYLKAMKTGSLRFRAGDYPTAVRQFILAAELNQGDAASRLHVVHALTAVEQYAAAVPALRRALQLQPKIVYLPLDIRTEYGVVGDFEKHVSRLAAAAREADTDAGLWLLLGYYHFYSGRGADAHQALRRAAELAPTDSATRRLLDVAKLSAPPAPVAPAEPAESARDNI